MFERQRVSQVSIDFRALDDGNGVNSNPKIKINDPKRVCFKFDVEERKTLAFHWPGSTLMTPEVEVHRKLLHGLTNKSFEIFFHERINSCVRDLLSSVQNLQPNDQEHLRELFVRGACEKVKDFLSNKDPKTMDISVAFKVRIVEVLNLGLDLDEDEDEEDDESDEEISDFIRMKPTSRAAIQALEKKVVIEEGDLLQTCGVCLDEFLKGMEVKMMPCSHVFHEDCIVQWLGKSNKCPLCRFEMPV